MGMNPETNRLEMLDADEDRLRELLRENKQDRLKAELQSMIESAALVRPDGSPVPKHWTVFCVDELVEVKGYTFKVAYLNETTVVLEPVGPVVVGGESNNV